MLTLVLTPVLIKLAPKLGFVDRPGPRKLQTRPIPRCGGIAVFIATHCALATAFLINWGELAGELTQDWWLKFLAVSSFLMIIGLIDDRFSISPWLKLLGQLITATIAFHLGFQVDTLLGSELPLIINFIVSILWIVGIINAFNLIDGIDGLASGLGAIGAIGLAGSLMLRRMPADTMVCIAVTGACIGFLRYNFHPARIFLGDSGSMFLGLFLAILPLSTSSKTVAIATVGVPLLAVGIPIFDTVLAIWRRFARKMLSPSGAKKVKIFGADAEHIHHRLLETGMTQSNAAIILYIFAVAMVSVGILAAFFASSAHGIFLIAFVLGCYVVVKHLARTEINLTATALARGIHRPTSKFVATLTYIPLDIIALTTAILIAFALSSNTNTLSYLKSIFLRQAHVYVTTTFSVLVITKTYNHVWSRARVLDLVTLAVRIMAGAMLACGITSLQSGFSKDILQTSILFSSFAVTLLLGTRIVRRALVDVSDSHRRHHNVNAENHIIYGAGLDAAALLQSMYNMPQQEDMPSIAALCVEDENLSGRTVHGVHVIPHLNNITKGWILSKRITGIILSSKPDPEAMESIREFSQKHNLKIKQVNFGFENISVVDE